MLSLRSTTLLLLALLASCCRASPAQQQDQEQQRQEIEPMVASASHQQTTQVQSAHLKQVLKELVNNAYQLGQASKNYLDIQPEFNQAWADFPYAPGYLAGAFRSSYTPYQQQHSQYKASGGASNPNSIGFGYIDWSGPVNPAVLYVPYNLPYYYKVPPPSPFFLPQPAVYQPLMKPAYAPVAPQPAPYQPSKPIVYTSHMPVYTPPAPKY